MRIEWNSQAWDIRFCWDDVWEETGDASHSAHAANRDFEAKLLTRKQQKGICLLWLVVLSEWTVPATHGIFVGRSYQAQPAGTAPLVPGYTEDIPGHALTLIRVRADDTSALTLPCRRLQAIRVGVRAEVGTTPW